MEKVIDKKLCTGCSACVSICPKDAITMVTDENGFKYSIIDQEKCINCGLCQRTCPVINTRENESLNICYAAYSKDEELLKNSSSGAIFSVIANYVLENNGIVIGASFDEQNNLNHIAITKKDDLDKLKGSKYLQSNLNNIFHFIRKHQDVLILFVGTPCQVAGLKSYIKNRDNLICIDLVCHGVPTPLLFQKYVKYLENKKQEKLLNFNFRDKSTGWDTYSTTATFTNKKVITKFAKEDKYMKIFLSDVALRDCCYNCHFKIGNKYSDITLGDFWGINNINPKMYNKKGVSAIIINTKNGQKIFDKIKSNLKYEECKIDDIVKYNPSLKKSAFLNSKNKQFFNELPNRDFLFLSKKYMPKKSLIKRIIGKIKKIIKRN